VQADAGVDADDAITYPASGLGGAGRVRPGAFPLEIEDGALDWLIRGSANGASRYRGVRENETPFDGSGRCREKG
jgi:hypothetical protein